MRKRIAFLLLISFAIYHFGYYVFYITADMNIEQSWNDKRIPITDLGTEMSVTVHVSLPYMSSQPEYINTNNSFKIEGLYYRVIKQTYENESLTIVYVLDKEKNKLEDIIEAWGASQSSNGINKNDNKINKSIFKDYLPRYAYDLEADVISQSQKSNWKHLTKGKRHLRDAPPTPPPINTSLLYS